MVKVPLLRRISRAALESLCRRFGSLRLARGPRGNEPGNRMTVAGEDDFLAAFDTVEEF
jgi:hypothetical protein